MSTTSIPNSPVKNQDSNQPDLRRQVTEQRDQAKESPEAAVDIRERNKTVLGIGNNGRDPDQAIKIANQGSLTDTGNAERFILRYEDKLRWVSKWGWLVWTGKRWEIDESDFTMRFAKETARKIYQEAAQADTDEWSKTLASWAGKSLNRSRLEAMIALSRGELAVKPEDFNRDPWLFNVNNGTIDLRTGDLLPHIKENYITKLSALDYDPGAECPTWDKFLTRIFQGDNELIYFIQKAVGYSLTGDISEQVFFFLYGTGDNGKSTFSNVINDLLGDYAMRARADVLMTKRHDSNAADDTALLPGIRFMLGSELGEGKRLNESLVKDLTGGDKLRARRLYHDSFEFYPTAKVWLYGNHKPSIYGTDEGIWRRPKLIPFLVTIPQDEKDPLLIDKLRKELPGILAWAVQGCIQWQQTRLKPPEIVNIATRQFRAEQDILGSFLTERCVISDLATVTAGALYEDYKKWAVENGLDPKSNFVFSRSMGERGYSSKNPDGTPRRDSNGRSYYKGLGLIND